MCGIAGGYWVSPPCDLQGRIESSLKELHTRGPDDSGFSTEQEREGVVTLGHRRLSIIDLSAAGHQPMVSPDRRYSIVFNGEIYNYRELRSELQRHGYNFLTDTDTEVLLSAWRAWGESCLNRLEGMFSFVVHDKVERNLYCARDAFGIKPFFYSYQKGRFVFSSTQRALAPLLKEEPSINWQTAYNYLVHGDYDSTEQTFINGVLQLPPGHVLSISLRSNIPITVTRWWVPDIREDNRLDFEQAAEVVRDHFLKNVALHLRSDVAVGAALSGGIDSSAIVCAMRYLEPDLPIKSFSYIAAGTPLSEEVWVDHVNGLTCAESFKVTAGPKDLLNDLDDMIVAQEEPFGSTSIYAQYRVFQLAKQQGITVTLDGQGADELLAGYSGYPGHRLLSLIETEGFAATHKFACRWSQWPGRSYKVAAMELGRVCLPDGLYTQARRILGRSFSPEWLDAGKLRDAGITTREFRPVRAAQFKGRRVIEQLYESLCGRGLPGLLRHADRNSMRFSVESRVPFLTPQLAQLLLAMPEECLISKAGETKTIFRAAMRGIVPDAILDRRDKIGFATPEREWLLSLAPTLRTWLLEINEADSFLVKSELLKEFDAIVAGKIKFSWQLWRWVNFVRWAQVSGLRH